MNRVPMLIACIFVALAPAWFGLVYGPARQQAKVAPYSRGEVLYPNDRVGLAKMGRDVYRANGCYHCHSQQVAQGEVQYNLFLTGSGASREGLFAAMDRRVVAAEKSKQDGQAKSWRDAKTAKSLDLALFLNTDDFKIIEESKLAVRAEAGVVDKLDEAGRLEALSLAGLTDKVEVERARRFLKLPQAAGNATAPHQAKKPGILLVGPLAWAEAKTVVVAMKNAGAVILMEPELTPIVAGQPAGDIVAREGHAAWGLRRSASRDYLYETPVMLGSQRVGPDLAHIGGRWKGDAWHYQHLYNPKAEGFGHAKSVMPPYRFLFTYKQLKPGTTLSAAEVAQGGFVSGGQVVVPKPAARALVAYLQSLQQPDLLPEAPAPKLKIESRSQK